MEHGVRLDKIQTKYVIRWILGFCGYYCQNTVWYSIISYILFVYATVKEFTTEDLVIISLEFR